MAGIRRAPQSRAGPPKAPLHQRILGKGAAELDLIDDLESELQAAYNAGNMDFEDYCRCCDALVIRRERAIEKLDKATGKPAPPKVTVIHARRRVKPKSSVWGKVGIIIALIIFLKLFGFF